METVDIYPNSGVTVYKISISVNTGRCRGNPGPLSFAISCWLSRVQGYRLFMPLVTNQNISRVFITYVLPKQRTNPFYKYLGRRFKK